MKLTVSVVLLYLLAGMALAQTPDKMANQAPEPPMLGIHHARGYSHGGNSFGSSNPDLTYHNGPVLSSVTAIPIFWGTSWSTYTGDKITGMVHFFQGMNGSPYAGASDEYSQSNGTYVGSTISLGAAAYSGYLINSSSASSNPKTSAVLNVVCSTLTSAAITPVTNSFYMVYGDALQHGSYCGWHSWGSCNGVNVQFGFIPNLDGIAGCDPQSPESPGNYSQGLAAIANVTAHEISETRTDPRGNAWYNGGGSENGDLCNWSFDPSSPYGTGVAAFTSNAAPYIYWKLQGEWSNKAYNAGTSTKTCGVAGFANTSGQCGCIDGDNPY